MHCKCRKFELISDSTRELLLTWEDYDRIMSGLCPSFAKHKRVKIINSSCLPPPPDGLTMVTMVTHNALQLCLASILDIFSLSFAKQFCLIFTSFMDNKWIYFVCFRKLMVHSSP